MVCPCPALALLVTRAVSVSLNWAYHGILEALGDNTYTQHRGDCQGKRSGHEEDRAVTVDTLATAKAARAMLGRGLDVPGAADTPGQHDSEDEAS